MPFGGGRYRFTRSMVEGAPADPGVYALWEADELIYYGRASGSLVSIQFALLEHLGGARGPARIVRPTTAGRSASTRPRGKPSSSRSTRLRSTGCRAATRAAAEQKAPSSGSFAGNSCHLDPTRRRAR